MTATSDRITEIAILTIVDGKVVDEWSTLVNPECAIPLVIQSLTGITDAMVRDAPRFRDIANEVHRRLTGHVFVAHNARFDYGFIKNEFRRLDKPFTAEVLCTVRLSRRFYPGERSHSLDALRERHQLTHEGRHRAMGDARAAWQFMEIVKRDHTADEVNSAIKALLKMPSLPPQLSPGVLDHLPEGPGVYIFYGVNDLPIYIGKANDIRSRVRSHFSSDYRSANDQRLSVEITRIGYEETAGGLGALLREAYLVKTLLPLRNHRLRRNREVAFIRLRDLNQAPEFLTADELNFADPDRLYGPFSTKSRARAVLQALAPEHGLCWNVMNTKKSNGPCFSYQLKRCKGYCVGQESLIQHNLRLLTALAPHHFGRWPVKGAITLKETHPEHGWQHVHVFENWLYRGTAKCESELFDLTDSTINTEFDADIYKILFKYLKGGGVYGTVKRADNSAAERFVAAE